LSAALAGPAGLDATPAGSRYLAAASRAIGESNAAADRADATSGTGLMLEISKQSDAELYATIEQSKDADTRGAARAELEARTLRRWRIVADRQARVAWLAMISACASAIAAIAVAVLAWMHR
jgi:hypothetical protein